MAQVKKRFHHRHLPNLTKGTKTIGWKILHLYFPFIIHYLTDKYEDRHHHLVVDTIYAIISIVLITVNIALFTWYVLFFTPAQIEVHLFAPTTVVNGEKTEMLLTYLNPNRDIKDARIDILLPDNITAVDESKDAYFELGELEKNQFGSVELTGVVTGSVGQSYDLRVMTSYSSYGRSQYEVSVHKITVTDSSFKVDVECDQAVTYESQINGTISYQNFGEEALDDIQLALQYPEELTIESVSSENEMLNYNSDERMIGFTTVEAGEQGVVNFTGVFHYPEIGEGIPGDSLVELTVTTSSQGGENLLSERVVHSIEHVAIELLAPPVITLLTGPEVMVAGQDLLATLVIINVDDEPVESIALKVKFEGELLQGDEISIVEYQGSSSVVLEDINEADGVITLPEIEKLNGGAQKRWVITIPTKNTEQANAESKIIVSGQIHSGVHDADIDLVEQQVLTKYNAVVTAQAEARFYGEDQKQLGYGPYPPQPWQTTGLQVYINLIKTTNDLSDVHVTAMLSDQVEWVAAGDVAGESNITWDEELNAIDWSISHVSANTEQIGAQFEIQFTPNHLQVGDSPNLVSSIVLSATDDYTEQQITQEIDAVSIPVTIGEPASISASIGE